VLIRRRGGGALAADARQTIFHVDRRRCASLTQTIVGVNKRGRWRNKAALENERRGAGRAFGGAAWPRNIGNIDNIVNNALVKVSWAVSGMAARCVILWRSSGGRIDRLTSNHYRA